jgi:hypothetical protein
MITVVSSAETFQNMTSLTSSLCEIRSLEDMKKICQESMIFLQNSRVAEDKLLKCLNQWKPLNAPSDVLLGRDSRPLVEDTKNERRSMCASFKLGVKEVLSQLKCSAKQEYVLGRDQLFSVDLCARENYLKALERRVTGVVISNIIASALALSDSMEKRSDVCSTDGEDYFVLNDASSWVFPISVDVYPDKMEALHEHFPELVEDIDSNMKELRQLEKEGGRVLFTSAALLVHHLAKRALSLFS